MIMFSKIIRIFYPTPLLAELSAVVIKQARKKRLKETPKQAIEELNSAIYLENNKASTTRRRRPKGDVQTAKSRMERHI